jgi:hypothetical protein
MMASGEIRFSSTTMRRMPVLAQSPNPPNPCPSAPSVVFTTQQGVYAKSSADLSGWLAVEGNVNFGSYNTPTNGSPYLSHGVGLAVQVGPVQVGFNWQQTSNDGGLSFQSSPTNFNFWNLNASSEGLTLEFSPPQAFSGFTIVANVAQVCTGPSK